MQGVELVLKRLGGGFEGGVLGMQGRENACVLMDGGV